VRNVKASVSERPMDVSLLGASFLGRLNGYEVSGGKMTLRW
jgi:predicted aspartyl protease